MTARLFIGDTRTVLRSLPDASVDLVLTSPPFLALRSYLPDDDPSKPLEMGSEPTPADFLDALLDVVVECRRVLTPTGTLAVELGDTYSGSGGAGGDYSDGGLRDGQQAFSGSAAKRARLGAGDEYRPARVGRAVGWPQDKSLCFVPQLFGASLAYGRNLLRPERSIEPWRVRNVVRWVRPNPPVGALGDKFRPATSELLVACTSRDRWFDLDAVRHLNPRAHEGQARATMNRGAVGNHTAGDPTPMRQNENGAPPLDWWEIPTSPYPGSHYATWPEALCVRPILAMCPGQVCTTCGEPRRRIAETTNAVGHAVGQRSWAAGATGRVRDIPDRNNAAPDVAERVTLGWTDCGHGTWRRGIVLDPFAGSGTTLAVAEGQGRDSIGIDLDARNEHLVRERVGMWLEVA